MSDPNEPPVEAPEQAEASVAPLSVPVAGLTTAAESDLPSNLAILPSRDAVLYPAMLLPLQARDQRWVRLLSDAVSARQPVGIALQLDPQAEVTDLPGLYKVGTAANIVRLVKLPDGSLQVLLQGSARIRLPEHATQTEPYLRADVEVLPSVLAEPNTVEVAGLVKNLQTLFQRVVQLSPVLPDEMAIAAANVDNAGTLAD